MTTPASGPPRPRRRMGSVPGVEMDPRAQVEMLLDHDRLLEHHEDRLGRHAQRQEATGVAVESLRDEQRKGFAEVKAEFHTRDLSLQVALSDRDLKFTNEVTKVRTAIYVASGIFTAIVTVLELALRATGHH